jgi:hypothetical protein
MDGMRNAVLIPPLFDFLFFFSSGWLIDELACLVNYLLFF